MTRHELQFQALCSLIAQATFEPFDIGPCVVTDPIDFAKDMLRQVDHRSMRGVFGQLLERMHARMPEAMKEEQRRATEVANLRESLGKLRSIAKRARALSPAGQAIGQALDEVLASMPKEDG